MVKAAKSEKKKKKKKKNFSTSRKARITRLAGWHEVYMYNCTSVNVLLPGVYAQLPGELLTIYPTAG